MVELKVNKKRGKRNIDFQTLLTTTYPLVKELVNRTPQLKEWLERGVKKRDPASFAYLEMQQSRAELRDELRKGRDELRKGMDGLKDELLKSSIFTALMSNPLLSRKNIEEDIIENKEKTEKIFKTIKEM